MKCIKFAFSISFLALISFSSFIIPNVVYGQVFNDISEEHIYYKPIKNIVDIGLMVGDLQGNFNAKSYVSKFDFIKILAKMAGYDENQVINNEVINKYAKLYKKWDKTANSQISFLLNQNIILENQLNDFVVIDKQNNEQLRALSKEELSYFLNEYKTYMDYKKNPNAKEQSVQDDKLDYKINTLTKIGDDLNLKEAVTRENLAVALDKFITYTGIEIKQNDDTNYQQEKKFEQLFAIIEKVFIPDNKIKVYIDGKSKLIKVSNNTIINIDGENTNFTNIPNGSSAKIYLKDDTALKIDIDTNLKVKSINRTKGQNIIGIIKTPTSHSIGLYYKTYEDSLYIQNNIIIIPLGENYKVYKNDKMINDFNPDMLYNAVANVFVQDGFVKSIIILDDEQINAELLRKNEKTITVQDDTARLLEIELNQDTNITKNGNNIEKEKLAIGDKLKIKLNARKAEDIKATSFLQTNEVIIKSINKTETGSSIVTLLGEDKKTYNIFNNIIDIEMLDINDKVLIYLENDNIYKIDILQKDKVNQNIFKIIDVNTKDGFIRLEKSNVNIKIYIDKIKAIYDEKLDHNLQIYDFKLGDLVTLISLKDGVIIIEA